MFGMKMMKYHMIGLLIKELRKKLGLDCIKTVRSVGYKLVVDEEN